MLSKLDRALLAKYLRPQWPRAVLLGVLLLAGIGSQLANPQIAKTFIDQAQAGEPFERLVRIALLFLGVALVTQVATVLETYVADDLGWRTTNVLRADLTRHVLSLDGAFHAEHGAGELIERVDGDVSAIAGFFSRFVVHVLGNAVFLVGVLVLLLVEDLRVGAVLGVFLVGAFVYATRGGGFVARRARETRRAAADLSGFLEERLGGLPDLKSNGADAYAMRGLHERLGERYRRIASSAMGASLFNGTIGLFFVVGTGAALALSAVFYGRGAMTLGGVYLVFRYATMMQLPLDRLQRQMNSLQQATGAIVRVRELLATQPHVVDGPGAAFEDGALSVEFDGVSFAYADEARPARHLVPDRTGRGARPARPDGFGQDDDLATALPAARSGRRCRPARRRRTSATPSSTCCARGSRWSRRTSSCSKARCGTTSRCSTMTSPTTASSRCSRSSAWRSGCARCPAGLDTELGPHGRGLSAGEAQLVALARVFLKDPGLVVLDEASSRLDPATERLLERAISRLLAGRTGVVIAHRLETVDRVGPDPDPRGRCGRGDRGPGRAGGRSRLALLAMLLMRAGRWRRRCVDEAVQGAAAASSASRRAGSR